MFTPSLFKEVKVSCHVKLFSNKINRSDQFVKVGHEISSTAADSSREVINYWRKDVCTKYWLVLSLSRKTS